MEVWPLSLQQQRMAELLQEGVIKALSKALHFTVNCLKLRIDRHPKISHQTLLKKTHKHTSARKFRK